MNKSALDLAAEIEAASSISDEVRRDYSESCASCRFFCGAYQRTGRGDYNGLWVDDDGWCTRYPPVFVGGESSPVADVDTKRFKQPGVRGADSCGEHKIVSWWWGAATPNEHEAAE